MLITEMGCVNGSDGVSLNLRCGSDGCGGDGTGDEALAPTAEFDDARLQALFTAPAACDAAPISMEQSELGRAP